MWLTVYAHSQLAPGLPGYTVTRQKERELEELAGEDRGETPAPEDAPLSHCLEVGPISCFCHLPVMPSSYGSINGLNHW